MRASTRLLAITLSGVAAALLHGDAQAQGPSFACAKATSATEKAICANKDLARLDRMSAAAFRQLRTELAMSEEEIVDEQKEFLAQRDACGADVACLADRLKKRLSAIALEPDRSDPRGALIGRYETRAGWMIVRRTLKGDYALYGQTGDPSGRWACDITGELGAVSRGTVTVEAGEEGNSRPVRLALKGSTLVVTEDDEPGKRMAGYTCGANGYVEGSYRRVARLSR